LLIAVSHKLDRANADRLAAITSAVISLAHGAGSVYDLGSPNKVIMDFDSGYVLVSAISVGAALGVLATRQANLGNLAYEMAVFANRAGEVISPQLIEELKSSVGS
jgi:predicted regulator of Ras-like GTPase activity (Roadblock/LC7/MglB family)